MLFVQSVKELNAKYAALNSVKVLDNQREGFFGFVMC